MRTVLLGPQILVPWCWNCHVEDMSVPQNGYGQSLVLVRSHLHRAQFFCLRRCAATLIEVDFVLWQMQHESCTQHFFTMSSIRASSVAQELLRRFFSFSTPVVVAAEARNL